MEGTRETDLHFTTATRQTGALVQGHRQDKLFSGETLSSHAIRILWGGRPSPGV